MYSAGFYRDIWYFHEREDKPFCVMFSKWTNILLSWSISFFSTIEEANEEIHLLQEMYCAVNRPMKIQTKDSTRWNKKYTIEYDENNQFYWGCLLLDFNNETIKYFGDGVVIPKSLFKRYSRKYASDCHHFNKNSDQLLVKDLLLRKPNEIVNGYKFQDGEYGGWLQYRWGNGKNAIGLPQEITNKEVKKYYKPKDKYFKKLDDEELKQFEETELDNLQYQMDKKIEKEKLNNMEIKYGW